nr:restriction endonuclease subunit S [Streptomyces sp. SID9727]
MPGDVLINSTGTGTLGRIGYFQGHPDGAPCMADTHVTVARVIPAKMDSRFLYYWLASIPFQEYIYAALVVGATNQIELNRDRLGDAPIPLPSLSRQRVIADFLDIESDRSSILLDKLRQFARDVDEREASLLGRVLNSDVTEVGDALPDGWGWVPLMHLTDQMRPIMYGIVLPGPNVDDGVPIVKGGDVAGNRLNLTSLNRTTRKIESAYARSRLQGDDLVIAIRGSVGEVAVVPQELAGSNLTQDAARITIRGDVDHDWLRLALGSPVVTGQIQSRVTGATIKGINIWDLKRVMVPCPPRSDQKRLAAKIQDEIAVHRALREKTERHAIVLAERRRALITAAVTGQIDVTTARGVRVP